MKNEDKYSGIILNDEDTFSFYKEYTCAECSCTKLVPIDESEVNEDDEVIDCSFTNNYNYGPEGTYGYSMDCHCGDEEYSKLYIIKDRQEVLAWLNNIDLEVHKCPDCGNTENLKLIKEGFGNEDVNLICSHCKHVEFIF